MRCKDNCMGLREIHVWWVDSGRSPLVVTQLCACRERNVYHEDSETCISHLCISDTCISERQDWLGNDPRCVRLRQPRDASLHAESMSQHAVLAGQGVTSEQIGGRLLLSGSACIDSMQRARNTRSDSIFYYETDTYLYTLVEIDSEYYSK